MKNTNSLQSARPEIIFIDYYEISKLYLVNRLTIYLQTNIAQLIQQL